MNINNNNNGFGFSTIIYIALVSFFGALCKEINDKSHDSKETLSIFFGEIVLHGFSGWIVGLCAARYLKIADLTSITIFAGIGGLFGYDLIKIGLKIFITYVSASKNINLDNQDFDELGEHHKDHNDKDERK